MPAQVGHGQVVHRNATGATTQRSENVSVRSAAVLGPLASQGPPVVLETALELVRHERRHCPRTPGRRCTVQVSAESRAVACTASESAPLTTVRMPFSSRTGSDAATVALPM